ncbi:hypothetical protein PROFUN_09697 [Planoprotostelium fungivorum]|uniref:Uncharacterized protein n=1 Tax=Planoprotostelium fungivorum TaxID=1890364 RepID=A0A2P6NER4_9EUKA|nr:hypothetical protein PROFUN_09697 [Planoprotostelium fungivorum]
MFEFYFGPSHCACFLVCSIVKLLHQCRLTAKICGVFFSYAKRLTELPRQEAQLQYKTCLFEEISQLCSFHCQSARGIDDSLCHLHNDTKISTSQPIVDRTTGPLGGFLLTYSSGKLKLPKQGVSVGPVHALNPRNGPDQSVEFANGNLDPTAGSWRYSPQLLVDPSARNNDWKQGGHSNGITQRTHCCGTIDIG